MWLDPCIRHLGNIEAQNSSSKFKGQSQSKNQPLNLNTMVHPTEPTYQTAGMWLPQLITWQPVSHSVCARCATEVVSTTCTVNIVRVGGWLSGCCGSVAEHWQLKPGVSWVRLLVAAGLFTFYFHLITSKFIYFQLESRCSQLNLEYLVHSLVL